MRFHLTMVSGNSKTGPIPVSTSSKDTCPDTCPFKENGCYAGGGPLAIHWRKVTEGGRGDDWEGFLDKVRKIPRGSLWRHNQAGDLAGEGDVIDPVALRQLVAASRRARGFTYTHKPMTPANLEAVREANAAGFTINLSGNSLAHADELAALGVAPVVAVVSESAPDRGYTPGGRKYLVCPAQRRDTNCAQCGICQLKDRSMVVAFKPHGAGKKRIEATLKE